MHRSIVGLAIAVLLAGCAAEAPSPSVGPSAGRSAAPAVVQPSPSGDAAMARPAPSPSPSAAPTSTPRADLGWKQIAVVEEAPERAADWRRLAGSGIGYVTVSVDQGIAWFSVDGTTWAKAALKAPSGIVTGVHALAGSADAVLLGGSYSPCSSRRYNANPYGACRSRPASWIMTDGKTWAASPAWAGPVGSKGTLGSFFADAWAVPGGWDAAQMFDLSDPSDEFEAEGPALWHSSDGIAWTLLLPQPRQSSNGDRYCTTPHFLEEVQGAADEAGRRVIVGEPACEARAWAAEDGRSFVPVQLPVGENPSASALGEEVLPGSADRPWRIVGWREAHGGTVGPSSWASSDLRTWTLEPMPDAVGGLARTAGRGRMMDVAVGWAAGDSRTPRTWVSDGGVEPWSVLAGEQPAIEVVADGPAGFLGLVRVWDAEGGAETGFEVWQLQPR